MALDAHDDGLMPIDGFAVNLREGKKILKYFGGHCGFMSEK